MDEMNKYKFLNKVYRQMANQRQHFQKQHQVLILLLEVHNISAEDKILDAACGTGDVATMIYSDGYVNVHAADGSPYMISQWPKDKGNIPVKQVNWQNFASIFKDWGNFNFVYFLGHSLPHLPVNELPSLFKSVFNGLNKGGILAFDIRPWTKVNTQQLTQAGREEGIKRYLGDINFDEEIFWLFEEVSYKDAIQEVKYCLLPKHPNGKSITESLTYYMYNWEYARDLLIESGFMKSELKIYKLFEWPYLVITAKKSD